MLHRRHTFLMTIGLAIALVVAACGSNSGSGGGGLYGTGNTGANQTATAATATAVANNTNTPSATSSSGSGPCYRYCSKGSPTPTSSGSTTIKTTSLTVNGKTVMVLTNSQGLTLYYRTSDSAGSVCSGGCASAWPPILSSSVPATSTTLPGKLTVVTNANGSQVEYNGHPLYTYSGDSAPGQANGEGFAGVWFVVTTDLAA